VSVARATSALKTSALIALGAFAVHQLRYLAGYGDGAGTALGSQGHAYLLALLPVLVVLAVSSVLGALVAVALSIRAGTPSRGAGWAFCTAALLVVFGVQETAEGLLSSGHPGGPAALLGHGGWLAAPIAIVVGRVVSLLLAGLGRVERRLAEARPVRTPRAPVVLGRSRLPRTRPLACEALAFGFARRPPPLPTGQS
jgi:hypothetical protein